MSINRIKSKILAISHLWNVFEELTLSAYMISTIVIAFYFSSRQTDSFITIPSIMYLSISTFFISYIFALPFYLFVERPFKNIINLILFPAKSVFYKKNDLDGEESSEEDKVNQN
jgi:peptidoglycan/LPS O-acetylase OafA/YrhL